VGCGWAKAIRTDSGKPQYDEVVYLSLLIKMLLKDEMLL